MEKLIRDGKVAVVYSPGYGAGWSTWNSSHAQVLTMHKGIAEHVEAERFAEACKLAQELCGRYVGGGDALSICWVPEGALFRIDEYDGSESVIIRDEHDWMVA